MTADNVDWTKINLVLAPLLTSLTGFFAIYGLLNSYKSPEGGVTRAGKIALIGGIVTLVLNLSSNIIAYQDNQAKNRRESERQTQQVRNFSEQVERLDRLLASARQSLDTQSISLQLIRDSLVTQRAVLAKQDSAIVGINRTLQPLEELSLDFVISVPAQQASVKPYTDRITSQARMSLGHLVKISGEPALLADTGSASESRIALFLHRVRVEVEILTETSIRERRGKADYSLVAEAGLDRRPFDQMVMDPGHFTTKPQVDLHYNVSKDYLAFVAQRIRTQVPVRTPYIASLLDFRGALVKVFVVKDSSVEFNLESIEFLTPKQQRLRLVNFLRRRITPVLGDPYSIFELTIPKAATWDYRAGS
ncbi:MAG: hypothetical protein HY216_13955 [Candidatus Rokubacteria bacterium]|nr:hypothetical protein [Candidatus Rokubacteria bacterium]